MMKPIINRLNAQFNVGHFYLTISRTINMPILKKNLWFISSSLLSITTIFNYAQSNEDKPERIIVSGSKAENTSNHTYNIEAEKISNIAGGTNLIAVDKENRLLTLNDALKNQPGIVIQSLFGGLDQPRLSIRGSGVQSAPLSRGVLLLQDGLPLNEADGSFHSSMIDVRDVQFVSIRRGANSTQLQSNNLGGELDFITYTGKESHNQLRYEQGSFGRQGMQMALGGESENYPIDARISLSYDHYDGYREHSASQRKAMRSTLGYTLDNFENRTWINWTDLRFDVPGPATSQMLEDDPKAILPAIKKKDPHRNIEQLRIANKSTWNSGVHDIQFGWWYSQTHDNFKTPSHYQFVNYYTKGAQFNYKLETEIISYRTALAWDHSVMKDDIEKNPQGWLGRFDGRAENIYASFGAGIHITNSVLVNLDLKGTHARRDLFSIQNQLEQSFNFLTPKVGLIWYPNYQTRLFANVSMSHEPASFNDIINPKVPLNKVNLLKLSPQKATSFEVGSDMELTDNIGLSAVFYRSLIKDEYITSHDVDGNIVDIYNYPAKTRHQGVELGLNAIQPLPMGDILYRATWTYNDFRFMGGEYNRKYIAGVPRNLISGEVYYQVKGLRFGPTVYWSPTNVAVDHGNHLNIQKSKPYALLGFNAHYQYDNQWSTYLNLDNITNKHYAASTLANPTVNKNDALLFPGNGFSVNAGIVYKF